MIAMMKRLTMLAGAVLALALFLAGEARSAELQWFGQAAFKITTNGGKVILSTRSS